MPNIRESLDELYSRLHQEQRAEIKNLYVMMQEFFCKWISCSVVEHIPEHYAEGDTDIAARELHQTLLEWLS